MDLNINGLEIPKNYTQKLVESVKEKKEFNLLLDSIILKELKIFSYENYTFLKKAITKSRNITDFSKSTYFKNCVKFCRSKLRKKTGLYLKNKEEKIILKESSKKPLGVQNINKILLTHKSSFERFQYYPLIYKTIFKRFKTNFPVNKNKKIKFIDLGCGLNPLSYVFIEKNFLNSSQYLAVDVDKRVLNIIEMFFKEKKLNGTTLNLDVFEIIKQYSDKSAKQNPIKICTVCSEGDFSKIKSFKKSESDIFIKNSSFSCDIALLFKIIDLIEEKGHKNSEILFRLIDARMIVASFPKKTISGKNMNVTKKRWLERMLSRLVYQFETFEIPTETFYLIYPCQKSSKNNKSDI
ncbi:MAG TPA: hypothetical protein PLX15_01570 [Candidatus Woesearchaeota archaeon]|jgi:hypothetical protein|nr:hypothetical protein [Candidatus Woesearchaeota archaeon]